MIENYNYWTSQISKHSDNPNRIVILVGTKQDHRLQSMTEEQIRDLLKEKDYQYFETSSKSNTGINELFQYATKTASTIVEEREKSSLNNDSTFTVQRPIIEQNGRGYSCC